MKSDKEALNDALTFYRNPPIGKSNWKIVFCGAKQALAASKTATMPDMKLRDMYKCDLIIMYNEMDNTYKVVKDITCQLLDYPGVKRHPDIGRQFRNLFLHSS